MSQPPSQASTHVERTHDTLPDAIVRLLADFSEGSTAALARAVSVVENHRDGYDQLLAHLHSRIGHARRIGITGPPGAGKSTLTTHMAKAYRAQGHRVGIIAVDPTSPFTGGALLGDRIRMETIALDPGVFIRSMATRGSLGGLASATRDVCDVLDAFGIDIILIETVGVGQSELDVARTADTTLVVLVPESGDSIQTLKAGVMEIADVFVVNKADRPGADRLRKDIELMLGLRAGHTSNAIDAHHLHHGTNAGSLDEPDREKVRDAMNPARAARKAAQATLSDEWTPPVLRAIAQDGQGVEEIISALERHTNYLESSGELVHRRRTRLRERVMDVVERQLHQRLWHDRDTLSWLDAQIAALESGSVAPLAVANALRARSASLLAGN